MLELLGSPRNLVEGALCLILLRWGYQVVDIGNLPYGHQRTFGLLKLLRAGLPANGSLNHHLGQVAQGS